ncbi:peptide deformylase [Neokomagataea thailandica NBRC 106555]|uniref:Peptide deformylase n=2 Tax=Neokomagataea TaxID=1223423 RepID=A0A4Y6V620_9PROT|nr:MULTISPECIES: peptide deformylase [Neokomagataea]QDH24016.1 peptide deformylase [Neokomagataea tanensis]GBR52292.1 peptide deformylase [Neokomagataea thailandica NBRC 106555]
MAVLKILRMGHPTLHRVADSVVTPESEEIQQLVRDMFDTMRDANGAGLAAPQIGQSLRLFVYHVPQSRCVDGESPVAPRVLINPVLTPLDATKMVCREGCLSIPGLRADVPRFKTVHYLGADEAGREISGTATGFHANVLQHEYDHLEGILYPQRIEDFSRFAFLDEKTPG